MDGTRFYNTTRDGGAGHYCRGCGLLKAPGCCEARHQSQAALESDEAWLAGHPHKACRVRMATRAELAEFQLIDGQQLGETGGVPWRVITERRGLGVIRTLWLPEQPVASHGLS